MVLPGVDVAVPQPALRDGPGERDLDDVRRRDPEVLAAAMAEEIGREVACRPVETDGAARAAALLADLL